MKQFEGLVLVKDEEKKPVCEQALLENINSLTTSYVDEELDYEEEMKAAS